MRVAVSPCHTTGPYFPSEFCDGNDDLTGRAGTAAAGQHIVLAGRVLELGARPAWNMVVEIWQPDSNGIFRHPVDPRFEQADPGFWGWGRARTKEDGSYRFRTVVPGAYVASGGVARSPHINCSILGIGLTRRLVTTIFFSDGAGNLSDPIANCVPDITLRSRLIARREVSLDTADAAGYRFDITLRGEGETPFFVD